MYDKYISNIILQFIGVFYLKKNSHFYLLWLNLNNSAIYQHYFNCYFLSTDRRMKREKAVTLNCNSSSWNQTYIDNTALDNLKHELL